MKQLEFNFTTTTKAPEDLRDILAKRFAALAPKKRILAVRLDGFSHKCFYDSRDKNRRVECAEYSGCMPEGRFPELARALFHDIGHAGYQNAPREIVYVLPSNR